MALGGTAFLLDVCSTVEEGMEKIRQQSTTWLRLTTRWLNWAIVRAHKIRDRSCARHLEQRSNLSAGFESTFAPAQHRFTHDEDRTFTVKKHHDDGHQAA